MGQFQIKDKTELTSIAGTENLYVQEAGTPFTVKRLLLNTIKAWVASSGISTVYKQSSYAILDADGYSRIEVDTTSGAVAITLPLMANNRGRRIEIAFVKNDASLDVVTISPHATDANKLSNDLLGSMILAKVGDFIVLQESVNSGCWEVVNERITSQLRLNTYAGYGSTDIRIMRFTNLAENIGNMFSENHVSGYSGNAKGLEITANRSGKYGISYSCRVDSADYIGLTLNSSQLTTQITSVTVSTRLCLSECNLSSQLSLQIYLKKGDIVRCHTNAATITAGQDRSDFTCTYLGN
jgi:hypothetical protein